MLINVCTVSGPSSPLVQRALCGPDPVVLAARHFPNTPPHFARSLQTAAKCSYTKVGARKDDIVRLRPRVVLLWTPNGHEDARDGA